MNAARMDAIERPPTVGLLLGSHNLDGLCHALIWLGTRQPTADSRQPTADSRQPKIVERTQDVVAPLEREGEVEIRRVDDIAGALASKEVARQ